MKKRTSLAATAAIVCVSALPSHFLETAQAAVPPPAVFQAAGPSVASIQSMVDAFRDALGANNGIVSGPLPSGRREINWDGGGSATSIVSTPFDGFLVSRGARFTTPGDGFVLAPVDGLATTFSNPSYATIFQPFSQLRLFSPRESKLTTGLFFIPGGGEIPATTNAFGAVFSDVDQGATTVAFFDSKGQLLAKRTVPASPGSGSLSFLGLLFSDSLIASVTITTGTQAPGPNDSGGRDIVMMDDFLFGEPQAIEDVEAIQRLQAIGGR